MKNKISCMMIIIFSLFFKFISSNIWDNIYTQTNSPHFLIDDNFEVKLLSCENNSTAGQILLSSELGLIKISLILSESNIDDSFIQIIINFNEGKVYFDSEEKCLYKYIDLIEQVSPKFIINAYDLLSYFLEDENNYHYIVTNPLEIEESNNNTISLLAKNIINDFRKNFEKYENIYDKDLYADFIIDKNQRKINNIQVKTTYGIMNYNTIYEAYNITIEQFNGIHPPNECVEYK